MEILTETSMSRASDVERILLSLPPFIKTFPKWASSGLVTGQKYVWFLFTLLLSHNKFYINICVDNNAKCRIKNKAFRLFSMTHLPRWRKKWKNMLIWQWLQHYSWRMLEYLDHVWFSWKKVGFILFILCLTKQVN